MFSRLHLISLKTTYWYLFLKFKRLFITYIVTTLHNLRPIVIYRFIWTLRNSYQTLLK